VLKRLGRVQGRIEYTLQLQQGLSINMSALDEALFPVAGLLNFTAEVSDDAGQDQLQLCLQLCEGEAEERVAREVVAALLGTEPVAALFRQRALAVGNITFSTSGWVTSGTGKRQIKDSRQNGANAGHYAA
jgi:hypothetical protein